MVSASAMECRRLLRKLEAFLERQGLFRPGERVVVGVSGGPDSLCLLHALWSLREKRGLELLVAHCHHQLRGEEAERDAAAVAHLAQQLGLSLVLERVPVAQYRRAHHLSLEEAARELRYAFFSRVVRAQGAVGVAVGHTADDQVETILLHWLRGSGLGGLRGMQPRTWYRVAGEGEPLQIFRPLLEVSRQETEAYCAAAGLSPLQDSSNRDLRPLRNRVRWELLPRLRQLNPHIGQTLLRLSRSVGEDLALIEGLADAAWRELATEEAGLVRFPTAKLLGLLPALRRRLLLRAAGHLLGPGKGPSALQVEAMLAALTKPVGTRIDLTGGFSFQIEYGSCQLSLRARSPVLFPPEERVYRIPLPGCLKAWGWKVACTAHDSPREPQEEAGPWRAELDAEAVGEELWLRTRRPGDRFQPLGMDRPKKLQDFFVDAKVPRARRDQVPLVESPRGIVWVVGHRIAEWAKVTPQTKRVLSLTVYPGPEVTDPTAP